MLPRSSDIQPGSRRHRLGDVGNLSNRHSKWFPPVKSNSTQASITRFRDRCHESVSNGRGMYYCLGYLTHSLANSGLAK
jgi:hypothetical protein